MLKATVADLDARTTALSTVQKHRLKDHDLRRYNAHVEELNELISQLNPAIEALKARIAEYNDLLSG